jgi:hypothetical protein
VKYRNPKLLAYAKNVCCQHCEADDGTIVAAHSNHHDKGGATKASDCFIAYLCVACHDIVDGRRLPNLEQRYRDQIWLKAHLYTIQLLLHSKMLDPQAMELLEQNGSH